MIVQENPPFGAAIRWMSIHQGIW